MATSVPIQEVHAHFDEWLARVEAGEEVAILRDGKVVARLAPEPLAVPETLPPRPFGLGKGEIWIAPDAFDPMSEEELAEWYDGPIEPSEK